MPVVARDGAEEFYLVISAPGLFAPQHAQQHGPGHAVVHEGEGGGAHHNGFLGGDAHIVAEELAGLRDAQQLAVVAAVYSAFGDAAGLGAEHVQQGGGQRKLVGPRLAPGHVQLQPLGLQTGVGLLQLLPLGLELLSGHFLILFHVRSPFIHQKFVLKSRTWAISASRASGKTL